MNITLQTDEFQEAIYLYLREQGFNTDKFNIDVKVIAGRASNDGQGTTTRAEIELTKVTATEIPLDITPEPVVIVKLADEPIPISDTSDEPEFGTLNFTQKSEDA